MMEIIKIYRIEDMAKYYNAKNNTYEFIEKNKFLNVYFDENININGSITARKIDGFNFTAKNINCLEIDGGIIIAKSIYALYCGANKIFVNSIKSKTIECNYLITNNIHCDNLNCDKVIAENINLYSKKIAI